MIESISLVHVWLLFGSNCLLKFLMRLQLLRLLQVLQNKLHVVIHLNCVCNTVESMIESISLVHVWLLFGSNCLLKFLMRLQLLRLLQIFARAIYLVICNRLQIVYCKFSIDLSVRVPVYTFACTYFYSLIVCSMSTCCVNFNMNMNTWMRAIIKVDLCIHISAEFRLLYVVTFRDVIRICCKYFSNVGNFTFLTLFLFSFTEFLVFFCIMNNL